MSGHRRGSAGRTAPAERRGGRRDEVWVGKMLDSIASPGGFGAAPVVDCQLVLAAEQRAFPPSYDVVDLGNLWLGADDRLTSTVLRDVRGREIGRFVGFACSELDGGFLPAGEITLPVEISTSEDLELMVLPRFAGLYVFITGGELPRRLYMDHGGSLPLVYSAKDRLAATSTALLFTEAEYRDRFRSDLHEALIGREGAGGWISGSLTAHRDVFRVLPNHFLDLETWTTHRFWPRPGDFRSWMNFDQAVSQAAQAISAFSTAAANRFKVAVTMTAGFDSRALLAGCRASLDRFEFFTLEAPKSELDIYTSQRLAAKFEVKHRVFPLRDASPTEMAIWDRMVGDCMVEAPRRTHTTLRDLAGRDAVFTGMYGEIGRCRLYRQDFHEINGVTIDAEFILDRLTLPRHPELVANVATWLANLSGQPNSVILDLAFHELKFGSWSMGQRPITNSIKLNFLPFAQRPVFEAFLGVAPEEKGTEALFAAVIRNLWPELLETPINKYGDARDYLSLWAKVSNPVRWRRFIRDRLARRRLSATA